MLETCVGVWTDRHFPASAVADQCRAPVETNTPFAGMIGDPDSAMDAFMVAP
jgi:hypothetical protein